MLGLKLGRETFSGWTGALAGNLWGKKTYM